MAWHCRQDGVTLSNRKDEAAEFPMKFSNGVMRGSLMEETADFPMAFFFISDTELHCGWLWQLADLFCTERSLQH